MNNVATEQIFDHQVNFSPAAEGGYVVSFPDFPGCVTEGDSYEEALSNAEEILELWILELNKSVFK